MDGELSTCRLYQGSETCTGNKHSAVPAHQRSPRPPSPSLYPGSLTVGLLRQCQTIHGRDRNCTPPQLPPEWVTTLLFIVLGIISLSVTCGLMVMSRWRCEASRYACWIAFVGSTCSHSTVDSQPTLLYQHAKCLSRKEMESEK